MAPKKTIVVRTTAHHIARLQLALESYGSTKALALAFELEEFRATAAPERIARSDKGLERDEEVFALEFTLEDLSLLETSLLAYQEALVEESSRIATLAKNFGALFDKYQ